MKPINITITNNNNDHMKMGEQTSSLIFFMKGVSLVKTKELQSLIKSYRKGLITAKELVAILEKKLYNDWHAKENSQN